MSLVSDILSSHAEVDTPPPHKGQTNFASIMQWLKIATLIIPTAGAIIYAADKLSSGIQLYDGINNHLATLDDTSTRQNGAIASLSSAVNAQGAMLTSHSTTLDAQTAALARIEVFLMGAPPPARHAEAAPLPNPPALVPSFLESPRQARSIRHPCIGQPKQRC